MANTLLPWHTIIKIDNNSIEQWFVSNDSGELFPFDKKIHKSSDCVFIRSYDYFSYKCGGTTLTSETYLVNDTIHRDEGPAYITYDYDGILSESYFNNGKLHRDNGPAFIMYNNTIKNGKLSDKFVQEERWYEHDKLHREDGPAMTMFSNDGDILYERWCQNNKRHRIDGPAEIKYSAMKDPNTLSNYIVTVHWVYNDTLIVDPPKHWPLNGQEQIEFKLQHG